MRKSDTNADAWNTNTNADAWDANTDSNAYNTDSYAECNADGYTDRYTAPPHAQAAANTLSPADAVRR